MCAAGTVPTDLFADDLENPPSGNWRDAEREGWYYPQNATRTSFDATYATSGETNLWGDDRPTIGDYVDRP